MIVTWVTDDGGRRSMTVAAAYPEAAGRVLADDLGLREVRVGGRPPSGPVTEADRATVPPDLEAQMRAHPCWSWCLGARAILCALG